MGRRLHESYHRPQVTGRAGHAAFPFKDELVLVTPLAVPLIPAVEQLVGLGSPWLLPRTPSDYWLYATLFSSTCPVASSTASRPRPSSPSVARTAPTTSASRTSSRTRTTAGGGLTQSLIQHVSHQAQT
jgi:hypothetical protein